MEITIRGTLEEVSRQAAELNAKFNGPSLPDDYMARVAVQTPVVEQVLTDTVETKTAAPSGSGEVVPIVQPPTSSSGDLDSRGVEHDLRIHTKNKAFKADGSWKRAPGIDNADFDAIDKELLAAAAAREPEGGYLPPNGTADDPPAPNPNPPGPPGATPAAVEVPTGLAGELTTILGNIIANNAVPEQILFTDYGVEEGLTIPQTVVQFLGLYQEDLLTSGLSGLPALSEADLETIKSGVALIWPTAA